ncbi:hypothetical protein BCR35DRAFT_328618 [Leucosporidium creatinivorum]|uniref:SnoaL-like domain-containing protein n=1 Tax=Leucosporidium creatinivorum TaxID=106004 RepID=A0A1Y2G5S9_9BASI|nr:hypothetical protein BCR35DRAFT_328618 [Leucosporidium creatinivorum]
MSSPNKATVQAWINAFCISPIDIPTTSTLFGPTFRGNHLPHPTFEGSAEQFLSMLNSMIPEGHAPMMKVKKMVEEGDQVWVWSSLSGLGPTKETVNMFTLKDGKIVGNYVVETEGSYAS